MDLIGPELERLAIKRLIEGGERRPKENIPEEVDDEIEIISEKITRYIRVELPKPLEPVVREAMRNSQIWQKKLDVKSILKETTERRNPSLEMPQKTIRSCVLSIARRKTGETSSEDEKENTRRDSLEDSFPTTTLADDSSTLIRFVEEDCSDLEIRDVEYIDSSVLFDDDSSMDTVGEDSSEEAAEDNKVLQQETPSAHSAEIKESDIHIARQSSRNVAKRTPRVSIPAHLARQQAALEDIFRQFPLTIRGSTVFFPMTLLGALYHNFTINIGDFARANGFSFDQFIFEGCSVTHVSMAVTKRIVHSLGKSKPIQEFLNQFEVVPYVHLLSDLCDDKCQERCRCHGEAAKSESAVDVVPPTRKACFGKLRPKFGACAFTKKKKRVLPRAARKFASIVPAKWSVSSVKAASDELPKPGTLFNLSEFVAPASTLVDGWFSSKVSLMSQLMNVPSSARRKTQQPPARKRSLPSEELLHPYKKYKNNHSRCKKTATIPLVAYSEGEFQIEDILDAVQPSPSPTGKEAADCETKEDNEVKPGADPTLGARRVSDYVLKCRSAGPRGGKRREPASNIKGLYRKWNLSTGQVHYYNSAGDQSFSWHNALALNSVPLPDSKTVARWFE